MAPPLVLYDSWRGRYTDSPRAIHEELLRRGAPLRHVWVLADGQEPPPGASTVRANSAGHVAALARARYVVVNDLLPLHYVKPPGTTVVQCWHGTPLKKIGLDVQDATYPHARRYRWHLRRNSRLWDHLVSQNPFSTPIFRRAFRYDGYVLEVGYPRNDSLVTVDPAPIRARLGVPAGRTVLFAPTWRDTGRAATVLADRVRTLAAGIGAATLLLRLHKHEAGMLRGVALPPNVVDLSGHGHVNDVLAVADVLITDYSSVMFDFAVTGRPIVLFVPDLEHYLGTRGFYLDPVADGPGPLATDARDAATLAARSLGTGTQPEQYRQFRERFVPFDDGHAAERVVDAVFPS